MVGCKTASFNKLISHYLQALQLTLHKDGNAWLNSADVVLCSNDDIESPNGAKCVEHGVRAWDWRAPVTKNPRVPHIISLVKVCLEVNGSVQRDINKAGIYWQSCDWGQDHNGNLIFGLTHFILACNTDVKPARGIVSVWYVCSIKLSPISKIPDVDSILRVWRCLESIILV